MKRPVPKGMPDAARAIPPSDLPPIGPIRIVTTRGPVVAQDVPGMITMFVENIRDPRANSIGVCLYWPPANGDEEGVGVVHQMTPEAAETMAASLSASPPACG